MRSGGDDNDDNDDIGDEMMKKMIMMTRTMMMMMTTLMWASIVIQAHGYTHLLPSRLSRTCGSLPQGKWCELT